MWGYQQHFAHSLESLAQKVFAELGISLQPDVLLVGLLKPGLKKNHPVCIEPEEKKWPLEIFSNLTVRFREIEATHPLQNMFYGDAPSMADKPENMRRSSASMAVREALSAIDETNGVRSFCGSARPVEDYYVVPVLQFPNAVFERFPPLSLRIPDYLTGTFGYSATDLFQRLNVVSSLFYEGRESLGSIVLAKPDSDFIDYAVRFRTPVPLNQPRWARKILQMASERFALVCSDGKIYGLGNIKEDHDPDSLDAFTVVFLDHYQWELRVGPRVLMYSRFREPKLPQASVEKAQFVSNYLRLFKRASEADAERAWALFEASSILQHGAMLVISEDATTEAERLKDQGTAIEPVTMTSDLLHRVSGIDGSILLDPAGQCFAIGVILDGIATTDSSPARGSRYNSALRYVGGASIARLAIVVSEDRTVDLVPLLRPQISKHELEERIRAFEKASTDDYHADQSWLNARRFYIREPEAKRINSVLAALNALPREVGEIRYLVEPFQASSDADDSYFF
jgi:hypothetical protein